MSICGVIPAAGRGSRLGFDKPKLLIPITDTLTVWGLLKPKLLDCCDHIVVIMSPWGEPFLQEVLRNDPDRSRISVALQKTPVGMGDAVMQGCDVWRRFDDLCVIWGDQVHVSKDTLARSIAAQQSLSSPAFTLPLARMDKPYVEYRFDVDGRLMKILQSREGDVCAPGGWGDVGTFLLSVKGLEEAWEEYERNTQRGSLTGEINFLPFLVHLGQKGWNCTQVVIPDADEAKGINTREDLNYFHCLYKG